MDKKLLILAISLSFLILGSSAAWARHNATSTLENQAAVVARVKQARELLGKHYKKSIVKQGEMFLGISRFIREAVLDSLQNEDKRHAVKLARTILEESAHYKFDPIFIMAVIDNESSFNPRTVGTFGEIGLMQIKPDTAEWISKKMHLKYRGAKSLFDPDTNVKIGAAYLSYLRERFNAHSRLYLAAYNMGVTNVNRALERQVWPKEYPIRVMSHYLKFYSQLRKDTAPVKLTPIVLAEADFSKIKQTHAELF